jgi:hypothetical protein
MNDTKDRKRCPSEWIRYFEMAKIRTDELENCRSNHAKAIRAGQFLSPHVNRPVRIEVNGRTGTATLKAEDGRAKERRYFFEVVWDDAPPSGRTTASTSKKDVKKSDKPVNKDARSRRTRTRKASASKARSGSSTRSKGNNEDW